MRLDKVLIAKLFGTKEIIPNFGLKDVKSVLIHPIGDAVGDAVICTAYADQLREMYPNAKIGIFATKRNWEILSHCPAIDEIVEDNTQSYFNHRKKWDLLIDFNESFHTKDLVMSKILSPKLVMIFKKKERKYYHLNNIKNYDYYCPFPANHHVSRHLITSELSKYFSIKEPEICFEYPDAEKKAGEKIWQQQKGDLRVFIAPQGSIGFKGMPPVDIAKLLNKCAPEWREKTCFLLCNTKHSPAFFAELKELCDPDINIQLSPKTSLAEYVSLTATADVVVGVDSGTAHLACALKRPLLSFYVCHNIKTWSPLHRKDVPHLMLIANTNTDQLDNEGISWRNRRGFHLSQGSDWMNSQLKAAWQQRLNG